MSTGRTGSIWPMTLKITATFSELKPVYGVSGVLVILRI